MSQRTLALAAGTVALAVAGIATVVESPAPRWPESAARANEPDRVRIEHQVVRIPVTASPNLRQLRAGSPKPGRRTFASADRAAVGRAAPGKPAVPNRPEPPDRPSGFVSRAVQTIVGDGKFKPQPFPQPGG